MPDMLAEICRAKRAHIAACKQSRPLDVMESLARRQPAPRGFASALSAKRAAGDYGLIAEIKRASPTKGLIRKDFDPRQIARAYRAGGAACLSVLTDRPYFQGSDDDLRAAREEVELPILRKDFMLDPYQVVEARALGADCILLILAALTDQLAQELESAAKAWGMDVLIEVHDGAELARASRLNSPLIGINNRNLNTLEVNLETTIELAPLAPKNALLVAESGLKSASELTRLTKLGVGCFLVGESLLRENDVETATRKLLGRRP
jgi:indole-3-glycerol phosphate synthase